MLDSGRRTNRRTAPCRTSPSPPRAPGPSTTRSSAPGPVSYEDSISPEYYELEREAIFRQDLAQRRPRRAAPEAGAATSPRSSTPPARRSSSCAAPTARSARSTTSAATAATSSCGTDYPGEETSGTCRQFTCKYHGWRYGLEGDLTFVQQEEEFFDLDKADYGLAPVQCRRVGGVHLREPRPRQHHAAARLPRRARRGPRGLPVRRDDAGATSTGPTSGATGSSSSTPSPSSTTHRSCTRSRRCRRSRTKLAGLRLRGARLRASTVRTAWCRRGAACRRRRTSTW